MVETATFGAGCFWGVEHTFGKIRGLKETTVGYSGGTTANPTYQQVCAHHTGHAEVVQVKFDPDEISYRELLEVFFRAHNPTSLNQQGPDIGSQYRSVIFYHSEAQRKEAEDVIATLEKKRQFRYKIVTQIVPASEFYRAEEYHQKYYDKH